MVLLLLTRKITSARPAPTLSRPSPYLHLVDKIAAFSWPIETLCQTRPVPQTRLCRRTSRKKMFSINTVVCNPIRVTKRHRSCRLSHSRSNVPKSQHCPGAPAPSPLAAKTSSALHHRPSALPKHTPIISSIQPIPEPHKDVVSSPFIFIFAPRLPKATRHTPHIR